MRARAFLCALAASGVAAGCGPAKPLEAREVVPELKLEGVRFRMYREDSLRLSGEAVALSYRRDTREVSAGGLGALLLGGDGSPVEITAAEGSGRLDDRTFTVQGGVRVVRGRDVARTDGASYAPGGSGAGIVSGDQPVAIEGPGYRLEGTGFTLDPAAEELAIHGAARLDAGLAGER
jgi:lipopolysaccharide export system protein LptC